MPLTADRAERMIQQRVTEERRRQDDRWGGTAHDAKHSPAEWVMILATQHGDTAKACEELVWERIDGDHQGQLALTITELVQLAATAQAAATAFLLVFDANRGQSNG